MKIVVTSGHPYSGYDIVEQVMRAAGLAAPQPSRREGMTVQELHTNIFHAHEYDTTGLKAAAVIEPGKVWQEVGVDLFLGNLVQNAWGWADARSTWMLDFWKSFDKQTRFILVYCAPEAAIGRQLEQKGGAVENIDAFIASWTNYNSEILRFYNRNRERCLLVDAAAVMQAPQMLVEKAGADFGLHALPTDFSVKRQGYSALTTCLAKMLVHDQSEAVSLYEELESAADLSLGQMDTEDSTSQQAWQDYANVLCELELLRQSQQQQAAQLSSLQAQNEKLAKARDEQAKQIKEHTQENELLLLQLHQVQEELEHYFLKHEELAKANAAQAKSVTEVSRQLEYMTKAREEQTRVTAERTKQIEKVCKERDRQAALAVERQQQIEQLSQELAARTELPLKEDDINQLISYAHFWRNQQPAEVIVDMRREIDGENWYYPETDGRWAGPGEISVIRVPSLCEGKYRLHLDVADAMDADILASTQVFLNGFVLDITLEANSYPALLTAHFSTESIPESLMWQFELRFPKLVSPEESGSPDDRKLAIRLGSLRLASVD